MKRPDIRPVLRAIRVEHGLPYVPGLSGGASFAALAFWLISSEDLREKIAQVIDPDDLIRPASIGVDPIGHSGFRSLADLDSVRKQLRAKERDPVVLLAGANWNAYHRFLFRDRLGLIVRTTLAHADVVTGITRFDDYAALVHRYRQQLYYLLLGPIGSVAMTDIISELKQKLGREPVERELVIRMHRLAHAHLKRDFSKFRLYKNWRSDRIENRLRNDGAARSRQIAIQLRKQERRRSSHFLACASFQEIEDEKEIEIEKAGEAMEERGRKERGRWCRRRPRSGLCLSSLPPHGGLTCGMFRQLVDAARNDASANRGAALVLCQIAFFLREASLPDARLAHTVGGAYLVTPYCLKSSEAAGVKDLRSTYAAAGSESAPLHLSVGSERWIRIPDGMIPLMQVLLESTSPEGLVAEGASWLHERQTTWSRLKGCLRCNAPVWFGVPWLAAEMGLTDIERDDRPRAPGHLYYSIWDPQIQESRLLQWYGEIGFPTPPDPQVGDVPHCGSGNCVKPEVARQMVIVLDLLLSEGLPADLDEVRSYLNAVAALTRLLELLLTMQRNYPATPPLVAWREGRWHAIQSSRAIREKMRQRLIFYPPVLRALYGEVADVFHKGLELLRSGGLQVIIPGETPGPFAYGFLSGASKKGQYYLLGPRRVLLTKALLGHPRTSDYAAVHTNAFRNLSYYLLTSSAVRDLDVLALHDHIPTGGKGAFYKLRSGMETHPEAHEAAAAQILDALAALPGDPWPHRLVPKH